MTKRHDDPSAYAKHAAHSAHAAAAPSGDTTIYDLPLDELRARAAKVAALFAQAQALLPGLTSLTIDERVHSQGKFKNGEAEALASVFAVADAQPALFKSLADKDGGKDPAVFETQLLRDHLERRNILGTLQPVADFAQTITDSVLHLGEIVKPPALAAYGIASVHAQTDPQIRSTLQPASDFYGSIGRASARSRKKTKT